VSPYEEIKQAKSEKGPQPKPVQKTIVKNVKSNLNPFDLKMQKAAALKTSAKEARLAKKTRTTTDIFKEAEIRHQKRTNPGGSIF